MKRVDCKGMAWVCVQRKEKMLDWGGESKGCSAWQWYEVLLCKRCLLCYEEFRWIFGQMMTRSKGKEWMNEWMNEGMNKWNGKWDDVTAISWVVVAPSNGTCQFPLVRNYSNDHNKRTVANLSMVIWATGGAIKLAPNRFTQEDKY